MSKRIRFGLIFVGPTPASDGSFLCDLRIKHIDGCSLGGKHYVIFILRRAKKASDVLKSVEAQNRKCGSGSSVDLEEELLMASDGVLSTFASTMIVMPSGGGDLPQSPLVAVFDKGHAFQSHEIFRVIHTARLSTMMVHAPPVPGDFVVEDVPFGFWSWSSPQTPDSPLHKRAISELTSDLVEDSIKPSASKRVSVTSDKLSETEESDLSDLAAEDACVQVCSFGRDICSVCALHWCATEQHLLVGWEPFTGSSPSYEGWEADEGAIILPSPDDCQAPGSWRWENLACTS